MILLENLEKTFSLLSGKLMARQTSIRFTAENWQSIQDVIEDHPGLTVSCIVNTILSSVFSGGAQ